MRTMNRRFAGRSSVEAKRGMVHAPEKHKHAIRNLGGLPTELVKLFHRFNRQIMNPSLLILVTGNRHLIFHSTGDAIRNGLVILGRQQNIHRSGSFLDEGYRDSLLGACLSAFLMARAVSAHRHVAE